MDPKVRAGYTTLSSENLGPVGAETCRSPLDLKQTCNIFSTNARGLAGYDGLPLDPGNLDDHREKRLVTGYVRGVTILVYPTGVMFGSLCVIGIEDHSLRLVEIIAKRLEHMFRKLPLTWNALTLLAIILCLVSEIKPSMGKCRSESIVIVDVLSVSPHLMFCVDHPSSQLQIRLPNRSRKVHVACRNVRSATSCRDASETLKLEMQIGTEVSEITEAVLSKSGRCMSAMIGDREPSRLVCSVLGQVGNFSDTKRCLFEICI
jgi:hypothetical protein